MNIDSINTGFVIDHIVAGKAMTLYKLLGLNKLECPVAMIMNASSKRMGKKDIIKIDGDIDIDMDVIGYVDPNATVNVIRDGKLVEKRDITVPGELKNVLFCKNPRCITSTEQELPHIFRLTDKNRRIYRCIYCDTKANS
ncbi:MAG: aspartate carbamoyltransferase regulatory subunit [Clostridia bacterium]|jgi:aspartate carbamoyltransferase regulatory subunit|nr:aspartate carbamoyltransferase regulatory subunit [Clostridia bacterium]